MYKEKTMRLAISSWTVHGELSNGLDLLDFPNAAAEHGVHTLEICHFHLPVGRIGTARQL